MQLLADEVAGPDHPDFKLEGVSQGRLPDGGTNIVSFPTTPTPEASNYLPIPDVVINEVLTRTDAPLENAVEIQSTGTNPVVIGDWWISNSQTALQKFRIASGTTLAPGAFAVFYENQFNSGCTGTGTNFTFNAAHASDEGMYSVVVTNLGGSATSLAALLRVNTAACLTGALVRGDGAFHFTLLGRSNRNYSVEFTTDFSGWTNVTNITLSGPQAVVTHGGASNATSRFYRVRLNP